MSTLVPGDNRGGTLQPASTQKPTITVIAQHAASEAKLTDGLPDASQLSLVALIDALISTSDALRSRPDRLTYSASACLEAAARLRELDEFVDTVRETYGTIEHYDHIKKALAKIDRA